MHTPDASDKTERVEVNLNLKTVQRMLPLVQRIVDDILANRKSLLHLQPEEEALDRTKRVLAWPEDPALVFPPEINQNLHEARQGLLEKRIKTGAEKRIETTLHFEKHEKGFVHPL